MSAEWWADVYDDSEFPDGRPSSRGPYESAAAAIQTASGIIDLSLENGCRQAKFVEDLRSRWSTWGDSTSVVGPEAIKFSARKHVDQVAALDVGERFRPF